MADGGSAEAEAEGHVETSHQTHDGQLRNAETQKVTVLEHTGGKTTGCTRRCRVHQHVHNFMSDTDSNTCKAYLEVGGANLGLSGCHQHFVHLGSGNEGAGLDNLHWRRRRWQGEGLDIVDRATFLHLINCMQINDNAECSYSTAVICCGTFVSVSMTRT